MLSSNSYMFAKDSGNGGEDGNISESFLNQGITCLLRKCNGFLVVYMETWLYLEG